MVGIPAKNVGAVSPSDKTFTPYGITKEDGNKTDKWKILKKLLLKGLVIHLL